MTTYQVPPVNWRDHLAAILVNSESGDTIIVDTEAMRRLGEGAAQRMGKDVTIKVGGND